MGGEGEEGRKRKKRRVCVGFKGIVGEESTKSKF